LADAPGSARGVPWASAVRRAGRHRDACRRPLRPFEGLPTRRGAGAPSSSRPPALH